MPATRVQLEGIAALLYDLAVELTRHRRGSGPYWIMIADLYEALDRCGLDLAHDDFDAAIVIAVERCVLKTVGTPVHSISPISPRQRD
ncbi:MAG: hypothetical protein AB7O38_17760 [Pirellulaceae bacterium]